MLVLQVFLDAGDWWMGSIAPMVTTLLAVSGWVISQDEEDIDPQYHLKTSLPIFFDFL